jgi:hypothetical protein
MGNLCDVLSNLDDNSNKFVKDAIELYDKTRKGQLHIALVRLVAFIVSPRDTTDLDSAEFRTQGR